MTGIFTGVRSFFTHGRGALVLGILILTGIVSAAFQNCSDVNLVRPTVTASSVGQLCTRAAEHLEGLQKFIFIVDTSESMAGIDPAAGDDKKTRRVIGLRNLIDHYRDKNDDNFAIAVGAVYASSTGFLDGAATLPTGNCIFSKPRVPGEYEALQGALTRLDTLSENPQGNTPFRTVFDAAINCIGADVVTSTDGIYNVVVVTDGAPTDLAPNDIYAKVKETILAGKENPLDTTASSRVNLYFYFLDNVNNEVSQAALIYGMISAAHQAGGYRSAYAIDTGEGPLDYTKLGAFISPRHKLSQLYVTNMNAALSPSSGLLGVDSDGDGLPDGDEERIGTDPVRYSTNNTCSDLLFYRNGACPSSCSSGQEMVDTDHDGLSDCDELNLGTDRFLFDSDGDLVDDGLEYRIGSNPRDGTDALTDADLDVASVRQEAIRHTNVYIDDRKLAHRTLTDVSITQVSEEGRERCYSVTVNGLPIFSTREVAMNTLTDLRHSAGANVMRLFFLQVPDDIPSAKPTLLYGLKTLFFSRYSNGAVYGYDQITDRDFELYDPSN